MQRPGRILNSTSLVVWASPLAKLVEDRSMKNTDALEEEVEKGFLNEKNLRLGALDDGTYALENQGREVREEADGSEWLRQRLTRYHQPDRSFGRRRRS